MAKKRVSIETIEEVLTDNLKDMQRTAQEMKEYRPESWTINLRQRE
jgi:hypothetical protein